MKATTEIEELQKSLVYKMSLGSKELYHSNVWAWLIDQDPAFARAFIPDLNDNYVFADVTREECHRDLTIWYKMPDGSKQFYIVENKLKSIPNIKQLEDYTKDAGENMIEGVLTGIRRPVIMDGKDYITVEKKRWRFVSYESLSNKMKTIAHDSKSQMRDDDIKLIDEYLDNNRRIQTIVNEFLKDDSFTLIWENDDFDSKDYLDKMDKLGLVDLINKLSGSSLVSYVNEKLTADGFDREFFYTYESFNNKKPTLDFRLSNGGEKDEKPTRRHLNIGVQIEGNQYRRMVDRFSVPCEPDDIFNEFSKNGFFDAHYLDHKGEIIWPFDIESNISRSTSQSKKYCKYGNYCVYQYSTIEGDDLKFENLYNRIKNDLELAMKLMIENNKEPYHVK